MLSKRRRLEYLIENLDLVLKHKLRYGKSQYDNNAIERSLMIIGETMRVLSRDYGVDWEKHKEMIEMGDYIDHRYHAIDYSVILNTIDYDLPELLRLAKNMLKTERT